MKTPKQIVDGFLQESSAIVNPLVVYDLIPNYTHGYEKAVKKIWDYVKSAIESGREVLFNFESWNNFGVSEFKKYALEQMGVSISSKNIYIRNSKFLGLSTKHASIEDAGHIVFQMKKIYLADSSDCMDDQYMTLADGLDDIGVKTIDDFKKMHVRVDQSDFVIFQHLRDKTFEVVGCNHSMYDLKVIANVINKTALVLKPYTFG